MNNSNFIEIVRQALKKEKDAGNAVVLIDDMDSYLVGINEDIKEDNILSARQSEIHQAELNHKNERYIARLNNDRVSDLEMFKSVIGAGQSALKASMVINGGGAVALLAFTGKIWQETTPENVLNSLAWSILLFCAGVLSTAVASGTTYISQNLYSENRLRVGDRVNYFSIAMVLFSYVFFAVGVCRAVSSFGTHF